MNERIKILRKDFLKLNQEGFGKRLGVTNAAISKIEAGINQVTDQMVKAICREFNVNYIWLSTGKGEVFADDEDDYMSLIDRIMSDSNDFPKTLFKAFARFSEEDWKALEHMIDLFLEEERKSQKK